MKRVQPIVIKDEHGEEKYVLEFDRNSVRYAESQGFDVTAVDKKPFTELTDLFYFAFRKNHPKVTREQAEQVLQDIGRLSTPLVERLVALYNATLETLMADEDSLKNAKMTVVF